jgi:hypothetical protein
MRYPTALKRRLSRRRWVRKHLRRQRDADVLVVSHTKSGRTWLRVMISHLYHVRYGIPPDQLLKSDNLHQLNAQIPRFYFTRDTNTPTFSRSRPFVPLDREKRLILLVRDPRDVAVSFYYHVRNRASAAELDRKGISESARALSLYEFVVAPDLGVPRVVNHLNRWHGELPDFPRHLVVRYEDLRADPIVVLGDVMRFIGEDFNREELERAVEFGAFENLQNKEKEGYFDVGKLSPTDASDPDSFKVRRGKVGGFRDDFGVAELQEIDTLVEDLLPDFGYRPDLTAADRSS